MNSTDQNRTTSTHSNSKNRSVLAFLYSVPIGLLGGLIGLGGAEFRLPVLVGPLGYTPRQAVPLNLVVSLITLAAALVSRGRSLTLAPIESFQTPIISLILGAVVAAFLGAAAAHRLSNAVFQKVILVLLLAIGGMLIIEGFLPTQLPALVPNDFAWRASAGVGFGLLIGLVSSLLGVAGGELIIPTLVFAFGADIKTAGTASLLISLPTVSVGILRYAAQGAFPPRRALAATVVPMGIGSVVGAIAGGALVGIVSQSILKIVLGAILNISAYHVFYSKKHTSS